MTSFFKLNGGRDVSIAPSNEGLSKYANERLDNITARAIRRHQNALSVDAMGIYLWRRIKGGLICTCTSPLKATSDYEGSNKPPANLAQLRNQNKDDYRLPASQDKDYKVIPLRGANSVYNGSPAIPAEFADLLQNNSTKPDNDFEDLPSDATVFTETGTEISDEQLALMLSTGGVIGGDKTACGICMGTSFTHGYQLFNGQRLVLDASQEYPYNLQGSAQRDFESRPNKFTMTSDNHSYVQWVIDLPSFVDSWLTFSIRDNLNPASASLQLQWFYQNSWQMVTLDLLTSAQGQDLRNQVFRVVPINGDRTRVLQFTHAELIYQSSKPVPAAVEPLNIATNFELLQPVIQTSFEILASVDNIPRESVFQDTKFKYIWKVIDVTPKITSRGQVFQYTVNARTLHSGEIQNALQTLFNPMTVVAYRGLEQIEGGIALIPESDPVPSDLNFPSIDAADQYTP